MKKTAGQVIFQVVKKLVKFTLFFFVGMVEAHNKHEKERLPDPSMAYQLYKDNVITGADYLKSLEK